MKLSDVDETKQALPTRGIHSTPQIWTKEKSQRDSQLWGNSQNLWIVQNKIYDLTKYAANHPGGKQWIQLTKGQDITEHFIVHHLDQKKARQVLQKYYLRPVQKPQPPRFTFQQKGLYRTIKQRLLQSYKIDELQNWSKSITDGAILLTIWATLFILTSVYQSFLLAFLCGLSIYPLLGVAHNFVHMKHHPFRYLYSVTGFSHSEWQQMHCISHHMYPNTLLDYQIQVLEPIVYFLTILPKNPIWKAILKQFIYPMTFLMNILLKLLVVPLVQRKSPQFIYLIPLMQIPIIYLFTHDIITALQLFAVIHITAGEAFMKTAFVGHRTGREWTEGNQEIKDFAQHQILSSTDSTTNDLSGILSYTLYAGFNFHAIHHLFPTVDNHYLPIADKILVEQAEKKGICKNKVQSTLQGVYEIESNVLKRKPWRRN